MITLNDELEGEQETHPVEQEVSPGPPRARDLPALLDGLPKLSEDDARGMARDLDRARGELERVDGLVVEDWSAS